MIEITMKEILKSRGWKLETMADELSCSISQISKIKNGNIIITKDFQEKFQTSFPGYILVNDAINWKEKYLTLLENYEVVLKKYSEIENVLVSAKDFFRKSGSNLAEVAHACTANAELLEKGILYNFPLHRGRASKKA